MKRLNNKAKLIGGALIGAAILIGARFVFFPETLSSAATHIIDCVERSDAGCLMEYLGEEEKSYLELNQSKLSNLLSSYVNPTFSKFKREGDEVRPYEQEGAVALGRSFRRPDGGLASLSVYVVLTDDGPKAPMLVSELMLSTMRAKYYLQRAKTPGPEDSIRAYVDGARHDGRYLTQNGFKGMYRIRPEEYFTWAEWEANRNAILQRVVRAEPNDTQLGRPTPR